MALLVPKLHLSTAEGCICSDSSRWGDLTIKIHRPAHLRANHDSSVHVHRCVRFDTLEHFHPNTDWVKVLGWFSIDCRLNRYLAYSVYILQRWKFGNTALAKLTVYGRVFLKLSVKFFSVGSVLSIFSKCVGSRCNTHFSERVGSQCKHSHYISWQVGSKCKHLLVSYVITRHLNQFLLSITYIERKLKPRYLKHIFI